MDENSVWDEEQANRICTFAEKYYKPQFIAGTFSLLPWQRQWLRSLYGWRNKDGSRKWRKAFLTVAKKNGKNLLSSIVCLYELLASNTPSPLVISASTTRENARQIFDELKNSVNRNTKLKSICKALPSSRVIRVATKNAEFRSVSNDSGNVEGLNASLIICDEVHAWQNDKLYRAVEYSTIA